jgi:peptidoglycan/xylan/chitin deacetylase (PgdA/CDA1 family)
VSRSLIRCLAAVVTAAGVLVAASPATAGGVTPVIVDTARGTGDVVSLTFDDGPHPPDTLRLLAVLRRHHVKAVFCLVGDQVRAYPEVARRIAREGHVLCNHSLSHADLGAAAPDEIRADLEATSALIRDAVPGARIPYFRAPYGSWGQSPAVAAELGMQPLGWKMDIADWEPPGADVLLQRLRDGITAGSVVLMHDGGGDRSQTVEAVDRIIPELRAGGWRFTLPRRHG